MRSYSLVFFFFILLSMAGASATTNLYYEEATTINTTKWDNTADADWTATTTNACNGTSWSDTLTGASQIKSKVAVINTTGYKNISVTFNYAINALDAGEFLKFDTNDGSTNANWLNKQTATACGASVLTYYLPGSYTNNAGSIFNWTCSHNGGTSERCIVDDIYIRGDTYTAPPAQAYKETVANVTAVLVKNPDWVNATQPYWDFDGVANYIDTNVSTNYNTSHMVLAFWFRSNKTSCTDGGTIIGKNYQTRVFTSNDPGCSMVVTMKNSSGNDVTHYVSTLSLSDQKWHYGIVYYNATANTSRVYFDGLLNSTLTQAGIQGNSDNWTIGGSAVMNLFGDVDVAQLRIYNTEFNNTIMTDLAANITPDCHGLVRWWSSNDSYVACDAGTPSSDTCTYSGSGDWEIDCSDSCELSTPTNLGNNSVTFINSGFTRILTSITNWDRFSVNDNCRVNVDDGARIW